MRSHGYPRFLGLETVGLGEKRSVLRLPFDARLTNNGSVLHGGVAASLACIGARALRRGAGRDAEALPLHTASLHVSYVSAAVEQDVVCETRLLRSSPGIGFVEGAIRGADGAHIANTQATLRYRHAREAAHSSPELLEAFSAPFVSRRREMGAPIFRHLGIDIGETVACATRIRLRFREELADDAGFHEAALLGLFDIAGAMASHLAHGMEGRPVRAATIALQAMGLSYSPPAEDVVAVSRCVSRDGDFFWSDVRIAVARTREVLMRGGLFYRIAPGAGARDDRARRRGKASE